MVKEDRGRDPRCVDEVLCISLHFLMVLMLTSHSTDETSGPAELWIALKTEAKRQTLGTPYGKDGDSNGDRGRDVLLDS